MAMYIDPGTGSMLFTELIGEIGAGVYSARNLKMKLGFLLSGGNQGGKDQNHFKYVIFTDSKRYWNVFEPICDEFEKRGEDLVYMTASPDDPALAKEYEHVKCMFIGEGNKAYAKLNMLKADIVLSSTPGLDVYQWKRSRDVKYYVHILHAVSDASMYRMFGIDYYDSILLTGSYQADQVRELERLRDLPAKELPIVGLTYMDNMLLRHESMPSPEKHETTVLLAPSWGDSAIFSLYGGKIIDSLLKTGYKIVVRPHPQSFVSEKEMMDRLMKEYPDSEQLEWNRDNDNFEVLRRSDIMISDFSGVIFDFSLVFDRPIIYTEPHYDKAPYDACWIEDEPWTFKVLPKIGKQLTDDNMDSIKELIDECLTDPEFQKARDLAREESWGYRRESAMKIADYLINKRNDIKE
ncbi:MAG: CDP-glycerol glycerophosphotransferase family protein [Oscillospiraceae bacterium]|nr:CDP-glycerol glycerophosphotransferase family protein [Oscillospiraceae bacterium]